MPASASPGDVDRVRCAPDKLDRGVRGVASESELADGRRSAAAARLVEGDRPASRPAVHRDLLVPVALVAAAFVLLAIGVEHSVLAPVDRWFEQHLTPLTHGPRQHQPALLRWLNTPLVVALWLATIPVTLCILAAVAAYDYVRGTMRHAWIWVGGFAFALAVELLGKVLVHDPAGRTGGPLAGVNSGYPSGHAARAVLLAALVGGLFASRRGRFWAVAVVIVAGLQLKGAHTLSDIVGGLLLGTAVLLVVRAYETRHRPG